MGTTIAAVSNIVRLSNDTETSLLKGLLTCVRIREERNASIRGAYAKVFA